MDLSLAGLDINQCEAAEETSVTSVTSVTSHNDNNDNNEQHSEHVGTINSFLNTHKCHNTSMVSKNKTFLQKFTLSSPKFDDPLFDRKWWNILVPSLLLLTEM